MAKTRSQTRNKKKMYYNHLKTSRCRGHASTTCRSKVQCKTTKAGRRRSYCRYRTNHKGLSSRHA